MNDSLVSVVVPVYNCRNFIKDAINSLCKQTYVNLEILVCDDASDDGTWEILTSCKLEDDRIQLFRNEINKGVVFTRNFLISHAKGDFIAFQDGDDVSYPERIENQLASLLREPSIAACCCLSDRVTNKGVIEKKDTEPDQMVTLEDCLELQFMPNTLLVRREVYQKIGGLEEYFSRAVSEDLYWLAKIVERYKFICLGQPLYLYRFNATSITNTFSPEKFVSVELIQELIRQRIQHHTDWIETGDFKSIEKFRNQKFQDNQWLSEKYRLAAAIQRDGNKRTIALQLLFRAILLKPFAFKNYITLKYILSL